MLHVHTLVSCKILRNDKVIDSNENVENFVENFSIYKDEEEKILNMLSNRN